MKVNLLLQVIMYLVINGGKSMNFTGQKAKNQKLSAAEQKRLLLLEAKKKKKEAEKARKAK